MSRIWKISCLFLILVVCAFQIAKEPLFQTPANWPKPAYDFNKNPLTADKVELGRHLFYDPILSADSSLSCSSCHSVKHAFSDTTQFSIGIDGLPGKRNAMPIFNLGYQPYDNGFFWDGRATTLEDQAVMPIQDPLEMHEILPNVVIKVSRSDFYPQLFFEAR